MTKPAVWAPQTRKRALVEYAMVLVTSFVLLFLVMPRHTNIYEGGLVPAAAARVAPSPMVSREFYANDGPAQRYALAALFKLFGQSLLVERIYDLLLKSLVVTVIYGIAAAYCRRSIAAATAAVALLWHAGLSSLTASPMVPVCLLTLLGIVAILPAYVSWVPMRRLVAAGGVAGLAFLFGYDTGITLLVMQIMVLGSVAYWHSGSARLPFWFEKAWPVAAGFAIVVVPFACYLLLAPLHPIASAMVIYPSAPGHPAAYSPATVEHLKLLISLILVAIVAVALLAALVPGLRSGQGRLAGDEREERRSRGFLVSFGVLAFAMYFMGFGHVGLQQIYLGILPSLLLLALLLENVSALRGILRWVVAGLAVLSVVAAAVVFA